MDHRMTRPARLTQTHPAHAGLLPKRLDRTVSWSDFRSAVRYDPTNRLLVAVPAISAKRAEHRWLGEAVSLHTQSGEGDVVRREYEHGEILWSERTGAHEVHGEIAARVARGRRRRLVPRPADDRRAAARRRRRSRRRRGDGGIAHFEGGTIAWTARHGVAIVHGMARDIWALLGWEQSALGVPVADVVVDQVTGGLRGCFEHGSIAWSPAGGAEVSVTSRAVADQELSGDALDRGRSARSGPASRRAPDATTDALRRPASPARSVSSPVARGRARSAAVRRASTGLGVGGQPHRRVGMQRHDPDGELGVGREIERVESDRPRRAVPEPVGDDASVELEHGDVARPVDVQHPAARRGIRKPERPGGAVPGDRLGVGCSGATRALAVRRRTGSPSLMPRGASSRSTPGLGASTATATNAPASASNPSTPGRAVDRTASRPSSSRCTAASLRTSRGPADVSSTQSSAADAAGSTSTRRRASPCVTSTTRGSSSASTANTPGAS